MSNQLKENQESISQKVAKILEPLDTHETVTTIRNWLKADREKIYDMILDLNGFLELDGKIDAKKYYELIEQYRYTISLMEQAIIEA